MILQSELNFNITLTKKELRIVGLALIGKLANKEDIESALELNKKILESRKRAAQQELEMIEGVIKKNEEV